MSSNSDDDPVMRSSTERYDRVGANLDWFIILASASSIFFGFLLDIAINPPSYFTFIDNVILFGSTLRSNGSNSHVHNASYFSCKSLSSA